jgi:hypothetical protein
VDPEVRQVVPAGVHGQRIEGKRLPAHARIVQGMSVVGNVNRRIRGERGKP